MDTNVSQGALIRTDGPETFAYRDQCDGGPQSASYCTSLSRTWSQIEETLEAQDECSWGLVVLN